MGYVFVYITNPSKSEAKKIAKHLLNKKLVACANIIPIDSLYWWKGKIEKSKEHVLIVKTLERNYEKIKKEVRKIHSYTVPCIAKIKVNTNKKFGKWIREVVK